MMEKQIDPELIRQLEPSTSAAVEAEEDDGFVEAVIKIRGEGEKKDAGIEELLELLMKRLEDSGSLRPDDYNVFPLMQRAVIRAKKSYI